MKTKSKRYRQSMELIDTSKKYEVEEAVGILKQMKNSKIDETVEVSMKLGVDVRQSDQQVRGSVSLPKGTGKDVRIIVFASGQDQLDAEQAGAMEAGEDELIKKINDGWFDFDVAIAHPKMMSKVGKLGKVLGPKGLMPSPKSGTVTPDVAKAVKEFKAGKIEYRADSGGNVHAPVGKLSFTNEDLIENINAFIAHMKSVKPASSKGIYMEKVVVCSTFSPSMMLNVK